MFFSLSLIFSAPPPAALFPLILVLTVAVLVILLLNCTGADLEDSARVVQAAARTHQAFQASQGLK